MFTEKNGNKTNCAKRIRIKGANVIEFLKKSINIIFIVMLYMKKGVQTLTIYCGLSISVMTALVVCSESTHYMQVLREQL